MRRTWLLVGALLAAMAALCWRPIREDSVTLDEPCFIAAGQTYWHGQRYYLNVEHPPLMQLWCGLPFLLQAGNAPAPTNLPFATNWRYDRLAQAAGPAFYRYPVVETGLHGRDLLFHGGHDAGRLVTWARWLQVLVVLGTGLVIFGWARRVAGPSAALLALATWVFNPVALAYGHLVLSDPGLALFVPLAAWRFSRLLEAPNARRVLLAGLATGLALLAKYTAVLLVPVFAALVALSWWKNRRPTWRLWLVPLVAWGVVLLAYFPHWGPAPWIGNADARTMAVPGWFQGLRLGLVPAEYFKGLAIVLLHVANGHPAYLAGEWSTTGWWYYFPVALLVKTPTAWFWLGGGAAAWLAWRCRQRSFAELAAVTAAAAFLAGAMTSRANIGVRHVLPVLPLVAVAVAAQYGHAAAATRRVMWLLAGGLALATWIAHPYFLPFTSELAGGPTRGQDWLVDSNYDWGQDANRLAAFLDEQQIDQVYAHYFGLGTGLQRAGVNYVAVRPDQARQLHGAWLVVSASYLMRPEWAWLRATDEPVTRVGYTLFVYRLP